MERVLLIAAVVAVSLFSAGAAAAVADFSTPRHLAYCGISEGEAPLYLICWRPSDGPTLTMTSRGRVKGRLNSHNRGYQDPAVGRVLRFGQGWTRPRRWACVSSSTGLTCSNASGHGWWLGRSRGRRLF